jgi:light-regulated signal transduction histidine kinase (bacteriophytochrome)
MSSGYSEEDIRRAAEIREWLIKEISDRQEEVERLRTTLSIIDNLLKQGSFKAAANLGFAAATTSTPAGPTTATAQVQQQDHHTAPASPTVAKKQQQQQQAETAAAPTLRATSDSSSNGNDGRNIKPLKRIKDDFLLANAEISPDAVVIVPAPSVDLNANTPPFKSFFLNRILEGMKNKDAEKVSQGALGEADALNYKVEEDASGIIKQIVINKYREKDRLQEIFNTSAWVFTRMLEKSGR